MMINLNLIFNPMDTKVKFFGRKNVNNNYLKNAPANQKFENY